MREKTENFTFRIPSDLRAELQRRADEEGRTLSNYIIQILKRGLLDG